jgi:hypothetical protein
VTSTKTASSDHAKSSSTTTTIAKFDKDSVSVTEIKSEEKKISDSSSSSLLSIQSIKKEIVDYESGVSSKTNEPVVSESTSNLISSIAQDLMGSPVDDKVIEESVVLLKKETNDSGQIALTESVLLKFNEATKPVDLDKKLTITTPTRRSSETRLNLSRNDDSSSENGSRPSSLKLTPTRGREKQSVETPVAKQEEKEVEKPTVSSKNKKKGNEAELNTNEQASPAVAPVSNVDSTKNSNRKDEPSLESTSAVSSSSSESVSNTTNKEEVISEKSKTKEAAKKQNSSNSTPTQIKEGKKPSKIFYVI